MSDNGADPASSVACITRIEDDGLYTGQLETWSPAGVVRKRLATTDDVDEAILDVVSRGYQLCQILHDGIAQQLWFKVPA
jgi:hypothetical protein